ncbi:acyl-CoA dehydrogenase [Frondihabitans sucicola]|uniref:Acyl-CoA dehydrogenase n=1 Tax=Frondihabitans sucicola TaxID=1268041 RepID=A0ABN6Y2M1_9MICO|nr:acyl-CoA dehydrogenase family protein [Frondihabitans sucicola]BDZ51309.1 acyl-CoA dehydrogenase [Frondihabitans sucicola]
MPVPFETGLPGDARYHELAALFRPIFARIGEDALRRERDGVLGREQLRWLTDAGFARLRTPVALGGFGARLSDLFLLLAELATVDVNLAHIWRNHFSFVEDRVHAGDDPRSAVWLERLGRGEIIGGGWSESGALTQSTIETTITPVDGGWSVDGVKYYSTGSVYATWFTVLAVDPEGTKVIALVRADQPGVEIGDDWDGFGQKLTGSGSVTYRAARVALDDAIPYESRYTYQSQYYQSVLHSLLVGIGRALLRDGVAALRARRRSHDNGTRAEASADPQILEVIGRVSALSFAAESALAQSALQVDRYVDSGSDADRQASWLAVAQAQSIITDAVLESATIVFDALGASGTSETIALDRHWRNARTLSSHNPRIFKLRLAGDALVNDADPTAH